MSKYHSKRIFYMGEYFDSKKELRRYQELLLMEKSGKIQSLCRQMPFELIPAIREPDTTGPRGGMKRGKIIERPVRYVADFVYFVDGDMVVEDVKGIRTDAYIIKRKLRLYINGIRILET